MRTIESKSYENEGARLKLSLVENGKTLPFRVMCRHAPAKGSAKAGTLAAVADDEAGREQFEFHCQAAEGQGWAPAIRVRLLDSIPPPPSGVPAAAPSGAPMKRKLGRPRKAV